MRTSEELLSKYSPNAEKCYLFKYKDCRFEKVYVDTLEKRFGVSTSNANENGPGRGRPYDIRYIMIYQNEMIFQNDTP